MSDSIDDSPQVQAAVRRNLEEQRDRLAEAYGQAQVAVAESELRAKQAKESMDRLQRDHTDTVKQIDALPS